MTALNAVDHGEGDQTRLHTKSPPVAGTGAENRSRRRWRPEVSAALVEVVAMMFRAATNNNNKSPNESKTWNQSVGGGGSVTRAQSAYYC